jgi:hypothetical protein
MNSISRALAGRSVGFGAAEPGLRKSDDGMPRRSHRVGALTHAQVKARRTRRWLEHPTAGHLRLPDELKGRSLKSRSARQAWEAMHRAGDVAATNAARHGPTSPEAVRARVQARHMQEELLALLGRSREELFTAHSLGSEPGRNALALGRY